MTTTFDLTSPDFTVYRRSQLRLLIGDATENDGPRPGQANYSDAELDAFIELEGDNMNRAAARALETLAAEWARYAGSYRLGPESEEARQSDTFAARAKVARELYGYTPDSEGDETDAAFVDWSGVYADWLGQF